MPGIDRKLLYFTAFTLFLIGISFYTGGCADEPSSLGLPFIPSGDTNKVVVFDSFKDTMLITSTTHKKLTNTSGSVNLMVGKNGNYDSKALLQFYGLDTGYSTATVNSAKLKLQYRNYYFPPGMTDSLGQISFDVYKLREALDLSRITLDSVDNNTFGTNSQGNYTGTPTSDSEEVFVNLNTAMVKDWLINAKDPNYANKNYGIALSPGNSSSVIKSFYSGSSSVPSGLKPTLEIIVTKNNVTDTLNYDVTSTLSLVNNTSFNQTNEHFFLQAGIAYIQVLKFDMSKIPSTATINDVQLFLTLDSSATLFSSQTAKIIEAQRVTDTAGLVTESFTYQASTNGNVYSFRLISNQVICPFQHWLVGEANYGMYIFPANIQNNLDHFAFYNTTASDPLKRPHVIIRYTPRKTQ